MAQVEDAPDLLLFCFPDHEREASARKALSACGVPIATTTLERHCADPLGRNWLPLGSHRRVSLLEVPDS